LNQLQLHIGDTVQIQVVGDAGGRRYYTRLIGALEQRGLIVTAPQQDDRLVLLREGANVIVRILTGSVVYAFPARVMRACSTPYPYVHLSYPQNPEQSRIRSAQRVEAELAVEIRGPDGQTRSAGLLDISLTGALLAAEARFAELGDRIAIDARPEIGGVRRTMSIPATVRNIQQTDAAADQPPQTLYGLQFEGLDPDSALTLRAYIYEQMLA